MKNVIRIALLATILRVVWAVVRELKSIDRSPEGIARRARDKARMGYIQHGP